MVLTFSERVKGVLALVKLLFQREECHQSGINVRGEKEFRGKVFSALYFLNFDPEAYNFVRTHIKSIWQTNFTMISPNIDPSILQVSKEHINEPKELIAGFLLRAAYRSKLYQDYQVQKTVREVPKLVWKSPEAKEVASAFASAKLKNMGVPQEILNRL